MTLGRIRPRLWPIALTFCSLAAMAVSTMGHRPIRFIWNGSASAPIGLYWVSSGRAEIGDLVLARLDGETERLFIARGYLPPNVPVLKRIAASEGDEICRNGADVSVNGRLAATALVVDSEARDLPIWSGCLVLNAREILLLNDNPRSLDGRYFGATERTSIIGRAYFLWGGLSASVTSSR